MINSGVVAATFALAANAFIVPSTVSAPDVKADGLDALTGVAGERVVKIGCPGCSFEGDKDEQTENAMVSPENRSIRR